MRVIFGGREKKEDGKPLYSFYLRGGDVIYDDSYPGLLLKLMKSLEEDYWNKGLTEKLIPDFDLWNLPNTMPYRKEKDFLRKYIRFYSEVCAEEE